MKAMDFKEYRETTPGTPIPCDTCGKQCGLQWTFNGGYWVEAKAVVCCTCDKTFCGQECLTQCGCTKEEESANLWDELDKFNK